LGNQIYEIPEGVDEHTREIWQKAQEILGKSKAQKRRNHKRKYFNLFLNLTWIVLLIVFVSLGGWYLYKQEPVKNFVGNVSALFAAPDRKTPTISTSGNGCLILEMSIEANNFTTAVPEMGYCYEIPEEYSDSWMEVFSSSKRVVDFTTEISKDASLHQSIGLAIQDSLQTGTLDLRQGNNKTTVQKSPEPNLENNASAQIPAYAEKRDIPLEIDAFAKAMAELGIQKVEADSSKRDKPNWMMYYTETDYLVLSVLGNTMPKECLSAEQLITVSTDPFEGAMQAGDVWINCK
jgi:hypothetical protein